MLLKAAVRVYITVECGRAKNSLSSEMIAIKNEKSSSLLLALFMV